MPKVKFCKNCRANNNTELFYNGYYTWINDNCYECPTLTCKGELTDLNISVEEYNTIIDISHEFEFIEAMIELKEKDPIEFQLKMSQFKTQTQQQESIKAQSDNKPKCPTCGSTKLSKVSTASKANSVFMWGLLSQKVKKTWHCDNCKYEW